MTPCGYCETPHDRGGTYCSTPCRTSAARKRNAEIAKRAKSCLSCMAPESVGIRYTDVALTCRCGASTEFKALTRFHRLDVGPRAEAWIREHEGC